MAFQLRGFRRIKVSLGEDGDFTITARRVPGPAATDIGQLLVGAETIDSAVLRECACFLAEFVDAWEDLNDEDESPVAYPRDAGERVDVWLCFEAQHILGIVQEVLSGGSATLEGKSQGVTGTRI